MASASKKHTKSHFLLYKKYTLRNMVIKNKSVWRKNMKFPKVFVVCIALALLFIIACSSATKPTHRLIHLSEVEVYIVGDIGPAGGRIFYDKGEYSDGWRYMEAAPASSEIDVPWGADSLDVIGTQLGIGSGKRNTELIIAGLIDLGETGKAALMCREFNINGFSDWFLPSRNELNLMYVNLHLQGIGDFSGNWYWSSSQCCSDHAWYIDFDHGGQYGDIKYYQNRVRAVRFF
jgi:hypothetical protein